MIAKYQRRPVLHVKEHRDGREVCNLKTVAGDREYKRRTFEMRTRQRNLCAICHSFMDEDDTTFEHEDLRGMGGARRDDRIVIAGKPNNFAVHGKCNGEKGSKRNLHH